MTPLERAAKHQGGHRVFLALTVIVALLVAAAFVLNRGEPRTVQPTEAPPPADGYFSNLPAWTAPMPLSDDSAARLVHRSLWEPRPENWVTNHTKPTRLAVRPPNPSEKAYDPRWNTDIIPRISGNFTGTTDEIFQWAAAKWGVSDNLIRSIAMADSGWRQSTFGDFVHDKRTCPKEYPKVPCPLTFGIVGTKTTSWPGLYPWNRDSTASAVDALGGWLRGCVQGYVWWLRDHGNTSRGTYRAGDVWGCVGAWYSGDWHDDAIGRLSGEDYINRVESWMAKRPWLQPRF